MSWKFLYLKFMLTIYDDTDKKYRNLIKTTAVLDVANLEWLCNINIQHVFWENVAMTYTRYTSSTTGHYVASC